MKGALMVCGTGSDAGKSRIVTGLCRSLARRGVSVAPFKAQNMANNSYVTPAGSEIGRAQGIQALAAGAVPHADMNPILLKPTGERTSQVVVLGRPVAELDARAYQDYKAQLRTTVADALHRLQSRYDVVVLEGAGSPAEINLLDHDLVNLWAAQAAGARALLVGDIERGGAFASLYGTVVLLPPDLAGLIAGFVINKFRGDPSLLDPGLETLATRTGIPTVGVLPFVDGLHLDAEDSLALGQARHPSPAATLDVAVVRLPRISNFTDFDALVCEPGVAVRYVEVGAALGRPDLVVLPGSKATVADLAWLRQRGFVDGLRAAPTVLGVCGGYQMLGRHIVDGVESGAGAVDGFGWLAADTRFEADKVTRQRRGSALGHPVTGYQIHHGRCRSAEPWLRFDDGGEDGSRSDDGRVWGTTVHGLFESDGFRGAFLDMVAGRAGKAFVPSEASFEAARATQFDQLADLLEEHLDMAAIDRLITAG